MTITTLDELEEFLAENLPDCNIRFETKRDGRISIHTSLKENEDGELVDIREDSDEEVDEEDFEFSGSEPGFESLEDESEEDEEEEEYEDEEDEDSEDE